MEGLGEDGTRGGGSQGAAPLARLRTSSTQLTLVTPLASDRLFSSSCPLVPCLYSTRCASLVYVASSL